jgi:hypothetical protein
MSRSKSVMMLQHAIIILRRRDVMALHNARWMNGGVNTRNSLVNPLLGYSYNSRELIYKKPWKHAPCNVIHNILIGFFAVHLLHSLP